jgi:ArsR family transcriptional regulator
MTTTTPTADLARTARLFHALSDETRLELVRQLSRGERCVCELTGALDAAQSRLSFHLKTLKAAGLVSDRRAGRWVYYSLVPEALEELAETALALKPSAEAWSSREGCCG